MDRPEDDHEHPGHRDEPDQRHDQSGSQDRQPHKDGGAADDKPEPPDAVTELRNKSAGWLLIAEHCSPEEQETVARPLEELGSDASHIRSLFERIRQQALLMHHLLASQAHAYTAMIDAGGHDNPEAVRAYEEATQFHIDVLGVNETGEEPS